MTTSEPSSAPRSARWSGWVSPAPRVLRPAPSSVLPSTPTRRPPRRWWAAELLAALPDGSSALVLAIEHLWAIPLRDAVRDAGGVVIGHRSLTPEQLVAFGMDVGDEVEAELAADEAAADSPEWLRSPDAASTGDPHWVDAAQRWRFGSMKRSDTSSRIVRRVVAVSDLVTSADVARLAGGRSVWAGPRRRRRGGHRRASSGTGGTPPTLAVIRDEIDAAVRTRTPVDDRERVAVAEFLTVLEHLGEDPFDEHANPVHVTASALIVRRRGLVLHRHKVLGTWVPLADASTWRDALGGGRPRSSRGNRPPRLAFRRDAESGPRRCPRRSSRPHPPRSAIPPRWRRRGSRAAAGGEPRGRLVPRCPRHWACRTIRHRHRLPTWLDTARITLIGDDDHHRSNDARVMKMEALT